MKYALVQLNPKMGDFPANTKKILDFIKRAHEEKCDLVLFPEMTLMGYHPKDLLERSFLIKKQLHFLKEIHKKIPKGLHCFLGVIRFAKKSSQPVYYNSVVLLKKNSPLRFFDKGALPRYDMFDERRFFELGPSLSKKILSLKGKKILITVCEDIWEQIPKNHMPKKVDLILNASASPFTKTKEQARINAIKKISKKLKAPLLYANLVGAQDDVIFDGGSLAMDSRGFLEKQPLYFEENLITGELNFSKKKKVFYQKETERLKNAIVFGMKDFARKSRFEKVHLGLSGGIDSAVTACLAAEAFGGKNVTCLGLPGPFSDPKSLEVSRKLSSTLATQWKVISIQSSYDHIVTEYKKVSPEIKFSTVHENIQSRIRGLYLMAWANDQKSLLLNTSNKSELAWGFGTLYGDLIGGLSPLGDLVKSDVYKIANLYRDQIPEFILNRPPSAELRPGHKDTDTLPPYSKLDFYVENFVEKTFPPKTHIEESALKHIDRFEFKRRQFCPILKLSERSFGISRRYPIH